MSPRIFPQSSSTIFDSQLIEIQSSYGDQSLGSGERSSGTRVTTAGPFRSPPPSFEDSSSVFDVVRGVGRTESGDLDVGYL